jgi:hypothetical protein
VTVTVTSWRPWTPGRDGHGVRRPGGDSTGLGVGVTLRHLLQAARAAPVTDGAGPCLGMIRIKLGLQIETVTVTGPGPARPGRGQRLSSLALGLTGSQPDGHGDGPTRLSLRVSG